LGLPYFSRENSAVSAGLEVTVSQNNRDSPNSPPLSVRSVLFGSTLIAYIVALFVVLVWQHDKREAFRRTEAIRLLDLDNKTRATIINDVESLRSKLGRAPKDQAELESLLGKPMPVVHDNGYPVPILYLRIRPNSFILKYELGATDDWIYNSDKPMAGWVQHWY
jgi:hypothetical protein